MTDHSFTHSLPSLTLSLLTRLFVPSSVVCVCTCFADKYLVCVEVAGRTKNDLCITLEGNMLKVSRSVSAHRTLITADIVPHRALLCMILPLDRCVRFAAKHCIPTRMSWSSSVNTSPAEQNQAELPSKDNRLRSLKSPNSSSRSHKLLQNNQRAKRRS